MSNVKKILCVADAPGPAEFLLPVLPLISGGNAVTVVAVGRATDVLTTVNPTICASEAEAEKVYNEAKPDLLVAAISSLIEIGPYVNNTLIELAAKDGAPIICLQDFWANHRWPSNKKMLPYYTAACVLDEFSKKLWKEDGFKGEIHVTGSPAFDKFAGVDVAAERARLRGQFNLVPENKLVFYVGQGVPRHYETDKKTFSFVVSALKALGDQNIKFVARPHPRAADFSCYQEIAGGVDLLDTSSTPFTENILPLGDVVVSITATNLIHCCLLRIPAVSVLLPGTGMKMMKDIGLDDFPPNTSGASVGIYEENSQNLTDVLRRIFGDESYRLALRQNQEKHFPLDTRAAEKVAQVILKALGK